MLESLFNKVAGLDLLTFWPSDIFRNTYFEEHLRTAASCNRVSKKLWALSQQFFQKQSSSKTYRH